MGERKYWGRTIGQDHLVDECLKVDLVLRETAHVALAPIAQRPLGSALAAPIEDGDGKAACAQVTHGLEIFLDELGAARKQAHGALAARRRRPAGKAQGDAIARL